MSLSMILSLLFSTFYEIIIMRFLSTSLIIRRYHTYVHIFSRCALDWIYFNRLFVFICIFCRYFFHSNKPLFLKINIEFNGSKLIFTTDRILKNLQLEPTALPTKIGLKSACLKSIRFVCTFVFERKTIGYNRDVIGPGRASLHHAEGELRCNTRRWPLSVNVRDYVQLPAGEKSGGL